MSKPFERLVITHLMKLERMVTYMVQNQAALDQEIQDLADEIDADIAQDEALATAALTLIAKLKASPAAPDFTSEIATLSAELAKAKTTNADVSSALSAAQAAVAPVASGPVASGPAGTSGA